MGHDAVHASAIGFHSASDVEIIDRARQEDRTIITADLDCPRLIATAGSDSPSLILFRGGDWTEAAVRARLAEVLSALPENEIQDSIITINRNVCVGADSRSLDSTRSVRSRSALSCSSAISGRAGDRGLPPCARPEAGG
ncbi:DUF5615 family PIN-like protein [Bradyrhizobium sp. 180]|nr:DUF5615 family PIN-like protein [Bradyrhizobium sp. CW12]MCK1492918.1 DUF5615 family PIN-like protein [Bradyrhizobium sp. 180]MCK1531836.1 DUF5615 family PIN-like protein [Bradyrhizobium sp. 182]MCK1593816.1 DUF5615 family PIN-like protein [Bradyrhizobium sp. 164]MCK1616625.1 DUF5615 family PIN-like protein [Bradyrhizobium sp. 159]MCK1644647.1 DUF5615 family PIN-like protein [Bradyrhizobium sp. 154]MCK1665195.1 DUF5615 family PIN-like protein [Bradyrhizobium sp. 153]